MRRLSKLLIACGAGACILVACADIFGIHGGALEDASTDAAGIVDAPYDYVTHDAITLDVNTAVCDAGVPFVMDNQAVWVSQKIGKDTLGCGARTQPCASIGYVLQHPSLPVVYIDDSTFEEAFTLGSGFAGFTVQGGWQVDPDAGTWTPVCDTGLAVIQAPDDAGSSAIDITGATAVTLRLLTVRSKTNGAPGTGESVYALRVINTSNVTLDNVTLLAQSGGAGAVGSMPSPAIGCDFGDSGSGGAGTLGTPGGGGQFSAMGFVPSVADDGGIGQLGITTAWLGGACATCWSCP